MALYSIDTHVGISTLFLRCLIRMHWLRYVLFQQRSAVLFSTAPPDRSSVLPLQRPCMHLAKHNPCMSCSGFMHLRAFVFFSKIEKLRESVILQQPSYGHPTDLRWRLALIICRKDSYCCVLSLAAPDNCIPHCDQASLDFSFVHFRCLSLYPFLQDFHPHMRGG